jgi:hypothetical protein
VNKVKGTHNKIMYFLIFPSSWGLFILGSYYFLNSYFLNSLTKYLGWLLAILIFFVFNTAVLCKATDHIGKWLTWIWGVSTTGLLVLLFIFALKGQTFPFMNYFTRKQAENCQSRLGPNADLHGCDFQSLILDGRNLKQANLEAANMDNASLIEANLEGAILKHASLINSNLTGVNLRSADLTNAEMTNADLTDADITDATLDGVDHSAIIGLTTEMVLSAFWKPNSRSYVPICEGSQDKFATQYNEAKGIHPLIFGLSGDDIFLAWEPSHISETELVLCLIHSRRVIETCRYGETLGPYFQGPVKVTIERRQHVETGTLYEARTGIPLAQRVWYGGEPKKCPAQVAADSYPHQEIDGSTAALNYEEIYQWLKVYVVRE